MTYSGDKALLRELDERMQKESDSLRAEFLDLVPTFTLTVGAKDLSRLAASDVTPDSLRSLLRERRIFSIQHEGQELLPVFQFDALGKPRPIIRELLEIFARYKARSDWDNALWFLTSNDWLDGATPLDLLTEDQALVKDAAEQAVLPHIE
jgi:hypothetical protein